MAIGNGRNDEALLAGAALSIVVIGDEGCAARTLANADVVCTNICAALDLPVPEEPFPHENTTADFNARVRERLE